MATNYGVNADKLLVDDPSDRPGIGEQGGVLRCNYDTFELTADLAASDEIIMGGLIPAGARVHQAILFFDDLDASGGTLDLGWQASADGGETADQDGFVAAADVTSAGAVDMVNDYTTAAGFFKKFTEPVQPVVTTVGDTDATTGTVSIAIWYSLD